VYLNVQMLPDMQTYELLQQKDFYVKKTLFVNFMTSDADNHSLNLCLLLTVEKQLSFTQLSK
jgi:hypothetical protein